MIWNKELLTDYQAFETPEKVGLGDGCMDIQYMHLGLEMYT